MPETAPQPRTIAPSKEDVLSNLAFFFGDPVVPEKLRDYSEQNAMTFHFPGKPAKPCPYYALHTHTTSGSMKSREERTKQAQANRVRNKQLADEVKERGGFLCVAKLMNKVISKVKSRAKDRIRASSWQRNNKSRVNEKNRKWAHNNPDSVSNKQKVYKAENKELMRSREKEKYHSDDEFRLRSCLRARLRHFFKHIGSGKPTKTAGLIGCSYEFLKEHLESQLDEEESLGDYQIDHIFPLSMYTKEEFYKMSHWSNLQPLKAFDNNSKHNNFPSKSDAVKVHREYWPNAAIGHYD